MSHIQPRWPQQCRRYRACPCCQTAMSYLTRASRTAPARAASAHRSDPAACPPPVSRQTRRLWLSGEIRDCNARGPMPCQPGSPLPHPAETLSSLPPPTNLAVQRWPVQPDRYRLTDARHGRNACHHNPARDWLPRLPAPPYVLVQHCRK